MLYLPHWATDSLRRREPALGAGPLVLYERIKGGLRIGALDAAAEAAGLRIGQNLADARALLPGLIVREMDRPAIEAGFADFADWHSNASPLVAVLAEAAPFGDLALDITGVAHLFGGERAMLATLVERLRRLGFTAAGAIAPTIGAAWAAAHFAAGRVLGEAEAEALLDSLPVAALRLDPGQPEALMQMGLKRIGQLRNRDRKALQARFGQNLVLRLDQAYGRIAERLDPRLPVAEHAAERRFAEPIGLIDDVLACAADLAVTLALRLERERLGAQAFHLLLYRVDHRVMALSVKAGRATRDAAHIARLFADRAERLAGEYDAGFGIDMIRLGAGLLSPRDSHQHDAFAEAGEADLERLWDRMASRLGPKAVSRSRLVDTHIPERAVRLEPVAGARPAAPAPVPDPAPPRPLRLLPAPEPVEVIAAEVPHGPPRRMRWRRAVYGFVRVSGPERLAPDWWRSGGRLELVPPPGPAEIAAIRKAGNTPPYVPDLPRFEAEATTRDYFIAEDEAGRRFWLFRRGLYGGSAPPQWYLHGFFA